MIELTRSYAEHSEWNVKVLGIGGAGGHAVDRLNRDGVVDLSLLVANTDVRALSGNLTTDRVVLGQSLTRGLGAGGDPELGRAAALESIGQVGEKLAGASLVVLLVGLGGGTGSGAAPCIAQLARAQGSHVAVFATLPFSFEGRRRRDQALEALDSLRDHSNLVVCFENDRMSAVADPASGVEDAFASVDSLLAQAVSALASMTRRRNILHSGLDEIAAVVSGSRSTALFGFGIADGEERARAAVARAFASPLLDSPDSINGASGLWVYVAGGPDLRLSEVQNLMQEVNERMPQATRLYFGAAVDPQMHGAVSVTLIAGIPAGVRAEAAAQSFSSGRAVYDYQAITPQVRVGDFSKVVDEPPRAEPQGFLEPEPEPVPSSAWLEPQPIGEVYYEEYQQQPAEVPSTTWEAPAQPFIAPVAPLDDYSASSHSNFVSEDYSQARKPDFTEPSSHVAVSRSIPTPPIEIQKERRRDQVQEPLLETPAPAPEEPDSTASHQISATDSNQLRSPVREPLAADNLFDLPPAAPEATAMATPAPTADPASRRSKDTVQEQMRFEPVNRGRFEKTDPTIVDGEDLDVPTFMRQRLNLE